ncbi:MAG: TonB-dependent receptor [Bacteroidetes bacterium]|nr:MAG: TonB-dependent receptor [Bacteroidota bacterium]
MWKLKTLLSSLFLLIPIIFWAQAGIISGRVSNEEGPVEFADVFLEGTSYGVQTNKSGYFRLSGIPYGSYTLVASYVGFTSVQTSLELGPETDSVEVSLYFKQRIMDLDAIVVTATKTFKRQTNSPIIVNLTTSEALANVQACTLSEGLKFQPGLRVETDCQTCNYTQLRMNGLAGGYSQILINGRPIFSPLTGLYGMEQLPVNMIDRIEVVRGGGSSLYGSSAVGGTVNVITKIPKKSGYELNYSYQQINGRTGDHQLLGNSTVVSDDSKAGVSFFVNRRQRGFYDHNSDNFSEIPLVENTSLGANLFFLPRDNQKMELSISNLNEYRFGGEMVEQPAYLTQQSEERTHDIWMANIDYQLNFNEDNSSLITYLAWQYTDRDHYTGILPDRGEELQNHLENPPYGLSAVATYNAGLQLNHRLGNSLFGSNVLTLGAEYILDEVYDEIPSYAYLVDQTTNNLGLFVQSDWELTPKLALLVGLRMDAHNLVEHPVWSPRISLLYKWKGYTQLRASYGAGFRAPQAFDTDLHIAFAGGGVSRVILSPELAPERSRSFSGSINYDRPTQHYVLGFTLEGFYTELKQAFFLQPIGVDAFGEVFQKQNGQGAIVGGATLEVRANYDRKLQLEAGLTLQSSQFDAPVQYIDGLEGIREFVRTPNEYAYATLQIIPSTRFNINFNYVYTGSMRVPHFGGAPNQEVDEIITSEPFHEFSMKLGYIIPMELLHSDLELYGGVKNLFNAYQNEFDIGKNRDSNFVYGPAQPRTLFLGIKLAM